MYAVIFHGHTITFHVTFLKKQREELVHQNNEMTLEREGHETQEKGDLMREREMNAKGILQRAGWRCSMRAVSVQVTLSVVSDFATPWTAVRESYLAGSYWRKSENFSVCFWKA